MKKKSENLPIKWFQDNEDVIKLDPSWQRGAVWGKPVRALLMDSILKEYDVPKIYLWERPAGGAHKYEVVDGQQRLRAIYGFLADDFPLPDECDDAHGVNVGGMLCSALPKPVLTRLRKAKLAVVKIHSTVPISIVSQMFSRLQMGMRLNPAELRNAIQSPLRMSIDSLARNHEFFEKSSIPSDRYRHQDYLAHLFTLILHDGKNDLKAPNLKRDYENAGREDVRNVAAQVNDTLDVLHEINELAKRRLTQKWIFIDLAYLVHSALVKGKQVNAAKAAKIYEQFDTDRLASNQYPQRLLTAKKSTAANKNLYDYIMAFNISGGLSKSVRTRQKVIRSRFASAVKED